MGRSKQRQKPRQSTPSRSRRARRSRPRSGQGESSPAAELNQAARTEQILALQRQIGNRSTGRLLSGNGQALIQRESFLEKFKAEQQAEEEAEQAKQNKVHEYDKATYEEKSALAKKLAQGLGRVMSSHYAAMIQDEKGLEAINVTAKVDRYLEAAFKYSERGFHDYIGVENKELVLEEINGVAGLYDKLALLLAMEPHHARLIGDYLGIPPLKGFDYEISTMTAGKDKSVAPKHPISVEANLTRVKITCKQEGEELWTQVYYMGAVGVTASISAVPATINASSGTFETLVFWSPRDFEGHVQLGAATAGSHGYGYSFGVATFHGNGSKGSLTIDTSGEVTTPGELGIGAFTGYMAIVGEVAKSKIARPAAGYKPKIRVTEDVDTELPVTFPEKSDKPGGSFKRDFLKFLEHALEAERLHATITGFRSRDKKYNVRLMEKRIKATRELIDDLVQERDIDPERVQIEEVEELRDEDPGKWKDPPRDRLTKVRLKGTITVRSPDEAD